MFDAFLVQHCYPRRAIVGTRGDIVPGRGIVGVVHAVGNAGRGGQQILAYHAVDPGAVAAIGAPFDTDGAVAVGAGDVFLPQRPGLADVAVGVDHPMGHVSSFLP